MRHAEYTDLFRQVAISHRWIGHEDSPGKQAFFRIIDTAENGLMAKIYLEEFLTAQRNITKDTIMVLMNFSAGYAGPKDQYKRKSMSGVFFILQKAKNSDFDEQEAALSRTEQIGEEIIAKIAYDLTKEPDLEDEEAPCTEYNFTPDGLGQDKIGPVAGAWFGTYFYFTLEWQFDLFDPNIATSEEIWQ